MVPLWCKSAVQRDWNLTDECLIREYPTEVPIPHILCDTPRMNRLLILPVLLLTLLVGNPAFYANFQKGLTAAQSGDYATALRE
jgi:hypothetical protein